MTKDDHFLVEPQSPYYLYRLDGLEAIITSIKVDGKNRTSGAGLLQ